MDMYHHLTLSWLSFFFIILQTNCNIMPNYHLIVTADPPDIGKLSHFPPEESGWEQTLAVYQGLLSNISEVLWQIPKEIKTVIAWSSQPEQNSFFPGRKSWIQSGDNFSSRTGRLLERAFLRGASHVVVLDVHTPSVTSAIIVDAFKRLDSSDAVIGPAISGNWYLLGARRFHPAFFPEIDPDQMSPLEAIVKSLKAVNLQVDLMDIKYDICTIADWQHHLFRAKNVYQKT